MLLLFAFLFFCPFSSFRPSLNSYRLFYSCSWIFQVSRAEFRPKNKLLILKKKKNIFISWICSALWKVVRLVLEKPRKIRVNASFTMEAYIILVQPWWWTRRAGEEKVLGHKSNTATVVTVLRHSYSLLWWDDGAGSSHLHMFTSPDVKVLSLSVCQRPTRSETEDNPLQCSSCQLIHMATKY